MPVKPENNQADTFLLLRKEAEKFIGKNNPKPRTAYSKKELDELLHELHVHQVELEMQNEQLRLSNDELELQRANFAGLYDLAPVGYFILDEYGIIKEVNDTGCRIMNTDKDSLVKKNFAGLVTPEDGEIFINFLESIQLFATRESCQLTLLKPGGKFYAQIEGIVPAHALPNKMQCYIAVIDVTERNEAKINQEKQILAATLAAQENERKRISEALHDSVGQLLYGIKLKIDQQTITDGVYKDLQSLLDQAIQETRNISFELAPSILKDFGLSITLNEMAKRLCTDHLSIQVITDLKGRHELTLEVTIFRVIQELVNNSIKHSGASKITISVKKEHNIIIEVADNGSGFDDEKNPNGLNGSGLAAIRNRLSLYEGEISIESIARRGSRVQITLKD
jgi:signal transduction histidine kinase